MSVLELSSTNTVFFVDLPDPCLLVVLQCSPDDPAGLCSAARAHSRLQCQCKCISADVYQQKQVARVMMYARKYSRVHSISLQGAAMPRHPRHICDSEAQPTTCSQNSETPSVPFQGTTRRSVCPQTCSCTPCTLTVWQCSCSQAEAQPGVQDVLGCAIGGSCEILDDVSSNASFDDTGLGLPTMPVTGPSG